MEGQAELRQMLADVIEHRKAEHGESLAALGVTLASITGRQTPYTKAYIIRMRAGQDNITDELARAIKVLFGELEGMPLEWATYQPLTARFMAPFSASGTIFLTIEPRRCQAPGCGLQYVPRSWNQKFCPVCRDRMRHGKEKAGSA